MSFPHDFAEFTQEAYAIRKELKNSVKAPENEVLDSLFNKAVTASENAPMCRGEVAKNLESLARECANTGHAHLQEKIASFIQGTEVLKPLAHTALGLTSFLETLKTSREGEEKAEGLMKLAEECPYYGLTYCDYTPLLEGAENSTAKEFLKNLQNFAENGKKVSTLLSLANSESELLGQVCLFLENQEIQNLSATARGLKGGVELGVSSLRIDSNEQLEAFLEKLDRSYGPLTALTSLDLSDSQINDVNLARIIERCPNIEKLDLTQCTGLTDDGLSRLPGLKKLKSLNLTACMQLTDKSAKHLSKVKSLQELSLVFMVKLSGKGIESIAHLENLTDLNLTSCTQITGDGAVTSNGIPHLSRLKKLQNLSLSQVVNLQNKDLEHLKGLKDLHTLNLSICPQLTNEAMGYLTTLTRLKKLVLDGLDGLSDAGISFLTVLEGLETISLNACQNVTDEGLGFLLDFKELKGVSIAGVPSLTNDRLSSLSELTNLQSLGLGNNELLTSDGIASLQNFARLQSLVLANQQNLTDQDVKALLSFNSLRGLRTLSLGYCAQITDESLTGLSILSNLGMLDLSNTPITKSTLDSLQGLENLVYLGLGECSGLSAEDVKTFSEQSSSAPLSVNSNYTPFSPSKLISILSLFQ